MMCYDKPEDAWKAFDKSAPPEIPRIMLCDTWCDEKSESLRAAECGATAVRLDTPRFQRGNMPGNYRRGRWELDTHGHAGVKIFLSMGVTREDVLLYRHCVDVFGVGGAIANAPVVDFGMDIVKMEGRPRTKRGKRSGIKQVYRMPDRKRLILPDSHPVPAGGVPLIHRFIENGRIVRTADMQEARALVQAQLAVFRVE